jgi:hypothetical protein
VVVMVWRIGPERLVVVCLTVEAMLVHPERIEVVRLVGRWVAFLRFCLCSDCVAVVVTGIGVGGRFVVRGVVEVRLVAL